MSLREEYTSELDELRKSDSKDVKLFASALDETVGYLDDFVDSERREPIHYIHAADAVDEAVELHLSSALFDGIRGKQGHSIVSVETAKRMMDMTMRLYQNLLKYQHTTLRNGTEALTKELTAI